VIPDATPAAIRITSSMVDALRAIVGREGVIQGEQELLVYECDAYTLEKHQPGVVVLPRSTAEVSPW
jgi:glycolate oxidase